MIEAVIQEIEVGIMVLEVSQHELNDIEHICDEVMQYQSQCKFQHEISLIHYV